MSRCKFHSEQVYYGIESVNGTAISRTGQLSLVWDTVLFWAELLGAGLLLGYQRTGSGCSAV